MIKEDDCNGDSECRMRWHARRNKDIGKDMRIRSDKNICVSAIILDISEL